MQISDAVEVIEVHGYTDANSKLGQGWKLLAVVPGVTSNAAHSSSYAIYVLGKPKPAGGGLYGARTDPERR